MPDLMSALRARHTLLRVMRITFASVFKTSVFNNGMDVASACFALNLAQTATSSVMKHHLYASSIGRLFPSSS